MFAVITPKKLGSTSPGTYASRLSGLCWNEGRVRSLNSMGSRIRLRTAWDAYYW